MRPHGISYRPDIDGLRAVAVIPVILFHLGVAQFGGGYVGVDVFFVISGYLISAGIQTDIANRQFSLLDFYERRARRILPALFVVVAFSLIAGWIMFLPDDYKDVGSSAVAVAAFASNILFWLQADYFSGPVDLKPLVHTWSLAVEEQYYILLPIFLWGVIRWGRSRFIPWTIGLTLLSFVISVAMVRWAPSGAYYLIPSRAWELLAGALLAQGAVPAIRSQAMAQGVASVGLALILASVFLLSEHSSFPGVNALWPVLGSAMIIHAGATTQDSAVARLLSFRPVLFIGLISYSLYLWHWPLIVFTRYHLLTMRFDPSVMLAVAGVTFVCAILSWRFVERPFRSRQRVGRRVIFAGAVVGLAAFIAIGLPLYKGGGAPGRFAGVAVPKIVRADQPQPGEPMCIIKEGAPTWAGDACFLSRKPGPVTLVWGDSHAYQYRRAIRDVVGPRVQGSILLYTVAGCPPMFGMAVASRPYCKPAIEAVPDILTRYAVKRVVLIGRWHGPMVEEEKKGSVKMLRATIASLRARGIAVSMVGDNPEYDFNNMPLLYRRIDMLTKGQARDFLLTPKYGRGFNADAAKLVDPSKFLDPMATLCRDKNCLVYANGQPMMSESNHLTYYGAEQVAKGMLPLFAGGS